MAQVCAFVVHQGTEKARDISTWVSVNISPVSLQSEAFINQLKDTVWISDRPKVYLEITERVPLSPQYLEELQNIGYGVFLDDFGQGHSSLIQLLKMFNALENTHFKVKIDGWFSSALHDKSTQIMVCEFIDILHRMGLEAVAECIETKAQLKLWQEMGADYGQGWLWKD